MATSKTFYWGGRWWKSTDKAAFAKWLGARGASYATWAAKHPQIAKDTFGTAAAPASKPGISLSDWAGKQYDESVKPEIDSLTTQRERDKAEADQRMKNLQGVYSALAGMLSGVGGEVSKNYESAANTDLAAGRGFGDQEQARAKAEGDKAEGYLTAAGAPQAAIEGVKAAAGGTGSGDLVGYTAGAIPASTTAREGAAFGSAAAMLPAGAVGQGQLALAGALQDAQKNDQSYGDKIAEITSGRTAGIQKIIQDFLENQRADRALALQEGYLGNTQRSTSAKITGVDPVTGQPTYESVYDKNKIKADAAKARLAAKSKDKTAHTAAIKAREDAFATARHSMATEAKQYVGHALTLKEQVQWSVKNHKPVSQAPKTGGGIGYAAAKKRLFAEYSDLLRYASGAGRAALKKRLNQMIDEVLQGYGLHPAASVGSAAQPAWAVAGAGPR
jgi:hypothetical protein